MYRCSARCRAAAREPAARRDDRVPSRLMSGTTAELPNDWWTTEDVLAFLRSAGAPISRATWAACTHRVRDAGRSKLDRTPCHHLLPSHRLPTQPSQPPNPGVADERTTTVDASTLQSRCRTPGSRTVLRPARTNRCVGGIGRTEDSERHIACAPWA